MTRESYETITGILRGHPRRIRLVCLLNHTLTGFIFVLYPAFLLLLFLEGSTFFLRALLVPAISFAAVTLFRRIFNAPRPYEKFGLPPAIEKDTAGKSFPSRHVFSVFIIAATIFYVHPSAGILLGLLGVVLAVLLRDRRPFMSRATSSQALLQGFCAACSDTMYSSRPAPYFPST